MTKQMTDQVATALRELADSDRLQLVIKKDSYGQRFYVNLVLDGNTLVSDWIPLRD